MTYWNAIEILFDPFRRVASVDAQEHRGLGSQSPS
jgi:hypothetical protein